MFNKNIFLKYKNKRWLDAWKWGLLISLGLVGAVLIGYATHWGPVVYSDAAGYLIVAENIRNGVGSGAIDEFGEFRQLTMQPPLYPLTVAIIGLLPIDVVSAARILNIFLTASFIILSEWLLWKLTANWWLGLLAGLVLLTSPLVTEVFSVAMSDPLFICLSLIMILAMIVYLERLHRGDLLLSAIAGGLALFTRYIGLAWVIGGGLCLALFLASAWKRRSTDIAIHLLGCLLPVMIWLIWAWIQPHSEPPRELQTGNFWQDQIALVVSGIILVFWQWFPFAMILPDYPYRIKFVILTLLVVIPLGVTVWAFLKHNQGQNWKSVISSPQFRQFGLLALYTASYLGSLAAICVVANPSPSLDNRQLAPVFLFWVLLFFWMYSFWQKTWPQHLWLSSIPLAFTAIHIVFFVPATLQMAESYHRTGEGFTSVSWRNSPTLQAIRGLPSDVLLVSNESVAVRFLTGRMCITMSETLSMSAMPDSSATRYGDSSDFRSQRIFRQNSTMLALFNSVRWQLDSFYGDETPERIRKFTEGLEIYGTYDDGALYIYPTPTP